VVSGQTALRIRHGLAVWRVPGRSRRRPGVAAWLLAAVIAFAVYLRLASTQAVNSDGASQALQAWDLLHGNVALRGWRLTDVSFYTTEIPEYMLVELVRGLDQNVVHVAAAVTYALATVFAALLAKGSATGREAGVRIAFAAGIMLAPQLGSGTSVLLLSPDHIGTSVPVLLTWLVLERSRPRWYVPVAASVLLAWSMVGDPLVLVIAILPLIVVCAVRLGQQLLARRRTGAGWGGFVRERWYEIALAGGAIAAAAVGEAVPRLIDALGGFSTVPVNSQAASLALIAGRNLRVTGQGLLLLGGAYFPGLPSGASTWFVALHIVGVALASCAVAVTAWRFFRGEALVPQLLFAGIVINVAAFAAGTYAVSLPNIREIAPVLPFAAVLAGRQLPGLLTSGWLFAGRRRARRAVFAALGVVLAGYVAGLGLELTTPPAPPQNAPLTAWLESRHLGTGLSGYWQSNVVTLTSGGTVAVRSVRIAGGRVAGIGSWNYKTAWYDPGVSAADFVVLGPGTFGSSVATARSAILATFGPPARTYDVSGFTVLWWHKNLLADVFGRR